MNLPTYNEYEQLVINAFAKQRIAAVIQQNNEQSDDKHAVIAFRASCGVQRLIEAAVHGWEIQCRFKVNKARLIDTNPSIEGLFFIPK